MKENRTNVTIKLRNGKVQLQITSQKNQFAYFAKASPIARITAFVTKNNVHLFKKKNNEDILKGVQFSLNKPLPQKKSDQKNAGEFMDEIIRRVLDKKLSESELDETFMISDNETLEKIRAALAKEIARRISLPVENPMRISSPQFHINDDYSKTLKTLVWAHQVDSTIIPECEKKIDQLRERFIEKATNNSPYNRSSFVPGNVEITFAVPGLKLPKHEKALKRGSVTFIRANSPDDKKIGIALKTDLHKRDINSLTADEYNRILGNPYTKGLMGILAEENACSSIKETVEKNRTEPYAARDAVEKILEATSIRSKINLTTTDGKLTTLTKSSITNNDILKEYLHSFGNFIENVFNGIGKRIESIKEVLNDGAQTLPQIKTSTSLADKNPQLIASVDNIDKATPHSEHLGMARQL